MRIPIALFLAALAVRAAAGLFYPDPAYPDSFYYVNVARGLADGRGFSIDYIWNFVDVGGRLPSEGVLPIPSNAHWMPLASLIQVPFIWLLGDSPIAYGLPFWIVGSLVPPLTYYIAKDAGLRRPYDVIAAGFTVLPAMSLHFMVQPDNFALFMLLGSLALWLGGRAFSGDLRSLAAGGLVVGLATLSRNDGVLLGVPFAVAGLSALLTRVRGRAAPMQLHPVVLAGSACAIGFLVLVAPWYIRQVHEFGTLSPSAANGRILWIEDFNRLWSVTGETTLASFLAQEPLSLLGSRVAGLWSAIVVFGGAALVVFLVPFVTIGWWHRRHDPRFRAWSIYFVTLFAFSALLFAVHVPYGTFYHSAVALMPHAFILALLGIARTVEWVAIRRRHWDPPRATRNFSMAALVIVSLVSIGSALRSEGEFRVEGSIRRDVAAALDGAGAAPSDRVMSADPGAYRYHAGRPGIVTPMDPLPVIEQAARLYDVRWLVLERRHIVPALVSLYEGTERPEWASTPVAVIGEHQREDGGTEPEAVLVAVCFAPDDRRCDA